MVNVGQYISILLFKLENISYHLIHSWVTVIFYALTDR